MRRRHLLGMAGAATLATGSPAVGASPAVAEGTRTDGLRRTDLWTSRPAQPRIFVREVVTPGRVAGIPLLLVHGARPGGVAAFDLPVPGGSLAGDLARAGFAVYVMDVRGFGRSGYPAAMSQDPAANPPQVRSDEAVADIGAVVTLIRRRRRSDRLGALGWATGGHWLGMYAALHPGAVTDLVLLNTLYSGTSPWALHAELADPARPGEPRQQPAWRAVTAASLTARWDAGLPAGDPDPRRDPAVRDAYQAEALRADRTSGSRTPPSFRNPTGPLIDAFYLAQGRQFYDASLIRARTLVLRGEQDFWSRPEDSERLMKHLTRAPAVRARTLPGASHYLHLERAEYGRDDLIAEVCAFHHP